VPPVWEGTLDGFAGETAGSLMGLIGDDVAEVIFPLISRLRSKKLPGCRELLDCEETDAFLLSCS
jgi:hypothetical protein